MEEMKNFLVDVIVPCYNNGTTIVQALDSIRIQPFLGLIIIVDDNSTDDSRAIIEDWRASHPSVSTKIINSDKNYGAGHSRNVALKHAASQFIAFLDADDVYLPGRFQVTQMAFQTDESIEAFGEVVGVLYQDNVAKIKHLNRVENARVSPHKIPIEYTGIEATTAPTSIFETLLNNRNGWIHLNGLTVRREALAKCGLFNPSLRLHQDTEFILRLAYHCNLVFSDYSTPVALRYVHSTNRINNQASKEHSNKFRETVYDYFSNQDLTIKQKEIVENRFGVKQKKKIFQRFLRW